MKSIEVEKKVRLEPHHIRKIEEKGQLIKETVIYDQYFDTVDYYYTLQNIWLRKREDIFELKIGIKKQNSSVDHYEEITDTKKILEILKSNPDIDLPTALSQKNILPFLSFYTNRRSYQFDDLKIDIDVADFGDLTYQVAEIEVVVPNVEMINNAEEKIFKFANELEIDVSVSVPAKITYYLYCRRQSHYEALVKHKVSKPIVT